jgi:hypothetical protein
VLEVTIPAAKTPEGIRQVFSRRGIAEQAQQKPRNGRAVPRE